MRTWQKTLVAVACSVLLGCEVTDPPTLMVGCLRAASQGLILGRRASAECTFPEAARILALPEGPIEMSVLVENGVPKEAAAGMLATQLRGPRLCSVREQQAASGANDGLRHGRYTSQCVETEVVVTDLAVAYGASVLFTIEGLPGRRVALVAMSAR